MGRCKLHNIFDCTVCELKAQLDEKDKRIEELERYQDVYKGLLTVGLEMIRDLQACVDEAVEELKSVAQEIQDRFEFDPFGRVFMLRDAVLKILKPDEVAVEQICGNCADFTMHANHPVSSRHCPDETGQCRERKFGVGFNYSCEQFKILTADEDEGKEGG